MDTSKLEKIGLTKNQSIIYLTLLKLGSTTVRGIIKESGLHSSRVYESLEKLESLGLINYVIKDFKKYFQAADPKTLLDHIEEKREIVNQLLPELIKLENTKKEEINVAVYKGREGLKTIHSEMLKEGKDMYLIGAKGIIFSELPYFMPNFERERRKRKLKFVCIWDKKEVKDKLVKWPLFEGKSFPQGFESNTVVNIFGDKVAIVLWKDKYPNGFIIDNKDVSYSFKKWFEFIYKDL